MQELQINQISMFLTVTLYEMHLFFTYDTVAESNVPAFLRVSLEESGIKAAICWMVSDENKALSFQQRDEVAAYAS